MLGPVYGASSLPEPSRRLRRPDQDQSAPKRLTHNCAIRTEVKGTLEGESRTNVPRTDSLPLGLPRTPQTPGDFRGIPSEELHYSSKPNQLGNGSGAAAFSSALPGPTGLRLKPTLPHSLGRPDHDQTNLR